MPDTRYQFQIKTVGGFGFEQINIGTVGTFISMQIADADGRWPDGIVQLLDGAFMPEKLTPISAPYLYFHGGTAAEGVAAFDWSIHEVPLTGTTVTVVFQRFGAGPEISGLVGFIVISR